jgi:threonine synthase
VTSSASSLSVENWTGPLACSQCSFPYPSESVPYICPTCGELFDFQEPLTYAPTKTDTYRNRGLDRYRKSLPLPENTPLISLGEGVTPLLKIKVGRKDVFFKCEQLNPTGSFKDRGTVVLISMLASLGVHEAVEDSSGNAGASFAAYAAKAGIRAKVFVPSYASGPKQAQIEAYGAEVVRVEGPRSAASEAVRKEAAGGAVYASHVYLPHGIAGMATVAFEIVAQLGYVPGTVVVPVGHGSLILGVQRGFEAMLVEGWIDRMPALIGVQAQACAPIWALLIGEDTLESVREGVTVAEGIRIIHPLRAQAVVAAVKGSGGTLHAVSEDSILAGREALGRLGLYVEPTSAVVWPALLNLMENLREPIVVVLTGSGLKHPAGA